MTQKKGDIIDAMIFFGKENPDPIQLSDYPERVVQTLRTFYFVWKIPSYIIPSKKQESKFKEWIIQLDDLNGICPVNSKMEIAMKMAKETYDGFFKKFMVIRPASVRTLLADAVRRLNDEKELIKEEEKEKQKAEAVDKNKQLVSVSKFRNLKEN